MWTDQTTNSTSWTEPTTIRTISVGMPVGLLLAITYAEAHTIDTRTVWTDSEIASTNWN